MEAAEVIARALENRRDQDQTDPILAHDPLRLNAHIYAFAVTDALREAGHTIVPTASIVNGIAQLAHVRGQVEGGYTGEVVETVSAETARMIGWIEAAERGEDR